MRLPTIVLTLVACTSDPPAKDCFGFDYVPRVRETPLADLPELDLLGQLTNGYFTDPELRHIEVQAQYGAEVIVQRYPDPLADEEGHSFCPKLERIAAIRIDEYSGGHRASGWTCPSSHTGPVCLIPTFLLTLPPELQPADAELVIADSSMMITVALGDTLLPRSIALVGASDWTFQAGQQVTVAWSHPADFARFPTTTIEVNGYSLYPAPDIVRADGTITFTLPANIGTGQVTLGIRIGGSDASTDISFGSTLGAFHAATIAP